MSGVSDMAEGLALGVRGGNGLQRRALRSDAGGGKAHGEAAKSQRLKKRVVAVEKRLNDQDLNDTENVRGITSCNQSMSALVPFGHVFPLFSTC